MDFTGAPFQPEITVMGLFLGIPASRDSTMANVENTDTGSIECSENRK